MAISECLYYLCILCYGHGIILHLFFISLPFHANDVFHSKWHILGRHSFEHSDGVDTVIAHLVGGIDAFIKLAHDWPISSYPLKLLSIKNRDDQSQSITLSFLCKVKVNFLACLCKQSCLINVIMIKLI